MSISTVSNQPAQLNAVSGSGCAHQSRHDAIVGLRKALRTGDLEAAKAAFAKVEDGVPKSVSAQANSATAQMRAALAAGDLTAAHALQHDTVRESRMSGGPNAQHMPESTPPNDWPVPPASGDASAGSIGSLLSVSA